MPPSIELRTRQSLALTPRLQQSVRLLQLSSLEFQQELRTALDTNPFLEYDATDTEDVALATSSTGADGTQAVAGETAIAGEADTMLDAAASDTRESVGQDESSGDYSSDSGDYSSSEYSGDSFSRSSSRQSGDSEGSDPADWARAQPTLREQLHDALRLYRLPPRGPEAGG